MDIVFAGVAKYINKFGNVFYRQWLKTFDNVGLKSLLSKLPKGLSWNEFQHITKGLFKKVSNKEVIGRIYRLLYKPLSDMP